MKTSTILTIFFVVLLLMGAALAAGMSAESGANNAPNTLGAQNVKAARPADPQTQQMLATIDAAANPSHFLQLNGPEVTKVIGELTDLETYWESKKILTGQDLTDAKEQIGILQVKYQRLQEMLNGVSGGTTLGKVPSPDEIGKIHDAILAADAALHGILDRQISGATGAAASAITMVTQLIDRNKNGAGVIPYRSGMSPMITAASSKGGQFQGKSLVDAAISMDCSGLISYVLIANGVIPIHDSTEDLANDRINFTILNIDANNNGIIDETDFSTSLANGTLLPGDLIISGMSGGKKTDSSHAVMVLSNNYTDTKSVGESTSPKDHNVPPTGPQYTSLQERVLHHGMTGASWGDGKVIVTRPHYHS